MSTTTINISLPTALYKEAKKVVKQKGYTSLSELFREGLRSIVHPRLTVNGFTPEFEQMVLEAEKDRENDIVWDGKGSYTEFMKKHVIEK